jgi:hypothetical protein
MFSIGEFAQAGKLLNGITVEELRGMLALRRAQLEQELKEYTTRLREVEARLDYIEGENAMPADDIMVKKIPAMGVVASRAPPARPVHGPARDRGSHRRPQRPGQQHLPNSRSPAPKLHRPSRAMENQKLKTVISNGRVVPPGRLLNGGLYVAHRCGPGPIWRRCRD